MRPAIPVELEPRRRRRWQPKTGQETVKSVTGGTGAGLTDSSVLGQEEVARKPSADMLRPVEALPRPLPLGGAEVYLFDECLVAHEAANLFADLHGHPSWQKRPIQVRDRETGERFEALEGRPTISFSCPPGRRYRYSGSWRVAEEFPECVLEAKKRVEALLEPLLASWAASTGRDATFNYCLANKYENGMQSVGKHADDEPDIVPRSPIATLSLGASRAFVLEAKEDSDHSLRVLLHAGSLILMAGRTQERFLHAIPKEKRVRECRISLTFRMNR